MNGKRKPLEIMLTAGVAMGMSNNIFDAVNRWYEIGKRFAPEVQNYIGTVGSGAVECGLPIIAGLGTVTIGAIAVVATDRYLTNRKNILG